jgi:hypothetical protein
MKNTQWLQDLQETANQTPFGTIEFHVKRHKNAVSKMTVVTKSNLKYDGDNAKAFADLERLINNLIGAELTGQVPMVMEFDNGTIKSINVKNKKDINYRDTK